MSVRVPPDLLVLLDAEAAAEDDSRAAVIRRLLAEALVRRADDGVDRAQIRRMLRMTPLERIRHMTDVANRGRRFRHAARRGRS